MRAEIQRLWGLGKLAARLPRQPRRRADGRSRLASRLGALQGLPQKIGQILRLSELNSGADDAIAPVEPRLAPPLEQTLGELERALGRKWFDCFLRVHPECTSASIGRVHRAVLRDERCVAVKIQHPDIARKIRVDLQALGWLAAPLGGLRRGFDLAAYRREVGEMVQAELDYENEARMLKQFAAWTAGMSSIRVPEVIGELSNSRVLTMTWLEGESIAEAARWPRALREQLSLGLLRLFLRSCFEWEVLHADPHPGNYLFWSRDGQAGIGLLDFGCVKRLKPSVAAGLRDLIADVAAGNADAPAAQWLARYTALGFNPESLEPMARHLGSLSAVLFEPFRVSGPYAIRAWDLGERVAGLLGEFRWNFRAAGPSDLLYFVRSFQGLIQYLKALNAPVNWKQAFEELPEPAEGLPGPDRDRRQDAQSECRSKWLRIRVREGAVTRVDLTFQARAAADLPDLIPEDLLPKLQARSIDLARITRQGADCGWDPGELFQCQDGRKEIRVWLE